ncbi:IS66 family transposase [Sedimenticola selenatireducens]|uniref:IS66 family transposase n=1 Tax=Sedimenticola selenatireducens TaxID=191960 RepID=UPI002AAC03CE|nr:IS66 family transposase [Sedimenticola selenatireducens]
MKAAVGNLPDDVGALKKIIAEQQLMLSNQTQKISRKERRIALLEEYIRLQRHRQFGTRSEKVSEQAELFDEAELLCEESEAPADEVPASQSRPSTAKQKPRGRKPLPSELPRIRIEHDLPEAEKTCPCGCQRTLIGEEASEQLDIIPAQVRVLVHVRKKYACQTCEAGVQLAPLPPQPIPKSNASAGLLAHVAIAKYQDALPLYRQEQILQRSGITLGRNTLAGWMLKCGTLVQPLLNLLNDQLLSGPIIHCDETPVQVLKEEGRLPQSKSYMWVRVSGPPDKKIVLYDYASSRSGSVAEQLLDGFEGYLQTDDYAGYHALGKTQGITPLGCWAHARRKFIEAQKAAAPQGKKPKAGKADMALSHISKLYDIERRIKDEPPKVRQQVRQQESVAVLEQLRVWLDKTLHHVLPKGALGKALGYLDKNWDKLTVYTKDGRLSIDNNVAENAIRPFVIGRKNWLFSDTDRGAKASAALYSLIETAKTNGQEPYGYLKRIFKELPATQSLDEIEALLPWNLNGDSLVRT